MDITNDELLVKILGKGLPFPIEVVDGKAKLESGIPLVRSSIRMILQWPTNNRYFLQNFGSKATEIIQEPSDAVTKSLLFAWVVEAIKKWETRIEVLDAVISGISTTKVDVTITYKIRNSPLADSFIVPFYKEIKN